MRPSREELSIREFMAVFDRSCCDAPLIAERDREEEETVLRLLLKQAHGEMKSRGLRRSDWWWAAGYCLLLALGFFLVALVRRWG